MSVLEEGAARLGVSLDAEQVGRFERYLGLLLDGNRRASLTSVTEPNQVRSRHFVDSLTLATAIEPSRIAGSTVLDVGSGGGLPGIPLAIAFPGCRVTLLEATGKKAVFLQSVGADAEMGLSDLKVLRARAETAAHDPSLRESFDIVVSRAVSRLPTMAELMLPFCRVGGVCVAYKGPDVGAEVAQSERAIALTGGGEARVVEIDQTLLGDDRRACLVVIEKIGPTPERYPRREGVPSRRPL